MRILLCILFSVVTFSLSAQTIDHIAKVKSSNAELHVQVSGKDASKPMLLVLHGGPGDVQLGLLPFKAYMGQALEEKFLVAYMHQRGAGKSSKVSNSSLTIANHVEDVHQVVKHLQTKYKKDKVILVGHSWGGALAAMYATKYEQSVDKLVLIATFQNTKLQKEASFVSTLKWAKSKKHTQAIDELTQYKESLPDENSWLTLAKWSSQANGGIAEHFDFADFIKKHKLDSEYPNWQKNRLKIANEMNEELDGIAADHLIAKLTIPALFVAGDRDSITPPDLMKTDFDNYSGEKHYLVMKNSHHLPFIDEPTVLAEAMIDFLK